MKLEIDRIGISRESSILHLAPEHGLYRYLNSSSDNYVCADIDLDRYNHIPSIRYIDLCKPETFKHFGSFDLIIHSHVIEHLPCNYTATLLHLHKLLKPGGVHIFSIPIYGRHYEEDLGPLSEDEKTRRFGQYDHCRRFSPKDIHQTIGAIFEIDEEYDLTRYFSASSLILSNIPEEFWRGYSGSSVFIIRKNQSIL